MKLTRFDIKEAKKKLEAGQTVTSIAKELNVTRHTIYRNVKRVKNVKRVAQLKMLPYI